MKLKVFKNTLAKSLEKNKLRMATLGLTTIMTTFTGCSGEVSVSTPETQTISEEIENTVDIDEVSTLNESMENIIGSNKAPFVLDDRILQIVAIRLNEQITLKIGYFYYDSDSLVLKDAFNGDNINLTYISEVSDDCTFFAADAANFCTPEQLFDGVMTKEYFDNIVATGSYSYAGSSKLKYYNDSVDVFMDDITYSLNDTLVEEKTFTKTK